MTADQIASAIDEIASGLDAHLKSECPCLSGTFTVDCLSYKANQSVFVGQAEADYCDAVKRYVDTAQLHAQTARDFLLGGEIDKAEATARLLARELSDLRTVRANTSAKKLEILGQALVQMFTDLKAGALATVDAAGDVAKEAAKKVGEAAGSAVKGVGEGLGFGGFVFLGGLLLLLMVVSRGARG